MSIFSSAPMSKLTIYKKDYVPKICPKRPSMKKVGAEVTNPIVGPLEEHVLPRFRYEKLPCDQTRYPDPKAYAEEVAEKYPSSRILLREPQGGPPDLDVIDKLYEDDNRSVYMVSYCRREDYDSKNARARKRFPLPDDWIVPLTTYKCSYRSPDLLIPGGVPKVIRIPRDNLRHSVKEREILEVKTGETIYNTDICNTGIEIIRGKLHGDANIRPTFDPEDLLKAKLLSSDIWTPI